MSQDGDQPIRTLKDYLHPTRTATPSCIMFPPNTPHFEFKPGMIQLLPSFHGLENENPYVHVREFEEVVATFHSRADTIDTVRERQFIEMMCNGEFLHKDPEEAIDYLNELAEKAHTWTGPSATDSTSRSRSSGIYHLKEEDSLRAQLEATTREIETLKMKNNRVTHTVARVEAQAPCFVCGGLDHLAQDCLTYDEMRGVYEEQCNALGMEETLKAFMEAQTKTNQKFDSILTQMVEENKDIKSQLTKLTNALTIQERGKIPSQPQVNPKNLHLVQESTSNSENIQGVNAITTRTGKVIEPLQKSPKLKDATPSSREDDLLKEPEKEVPIRVPFPQALKSGKILDNQGEILENLKQVKINLPLLHVIKQVPTYAKVIKDLCTIKRKHHVKKTTFLTEQVSAVIEQKTPPKYKDPGCPTIACQIGSQEFSQALLNLGASVNLRPYSVYLQLGLGEIKPTSVVLQLADRSCRKPRGIVEDVLLQIDKFYYPVDFLVLDTQSEVNTLKYLLSKKDAKARLIRWILLLQEFDLTIKDKKGVENVVADHLSRLEFNDSNIESSPIRDDFPDEHLLAVSQVPWYAHIVNYLVSSEIPLDWNAQDKRKFLVEVSKVRCINSSSHDAS
ncbi:hypothetical protein SLEP1_g3087 [Rubroshorea leprosula]|uniref:CCHC-type domain-containing protein n=1 Tax=Rubroshorea leprosula TaxID=152421 RepID=A0AAV5HSX8_9ROSI|nr:hypothetical protein SLEP1_g3087 [Rubroshorea leprosula]